MKGLITAMIIIICSPGLVSVDTLSGLPEIERDMRALELYIQDKKDYKEYCPRLEWKQPHLDVYKQTLQSYLPEGCKQ